MSGTIHQTPFRHYHRKEDGTTYFVFSGEIHSAPTCAPTAESEHPRGYCSFDVEGGALAVKEWESPSEFDPFRREVEEALGLPLTLNQKEKVRDAINAMGCEWKSDYDYPDFLSVYPRNPDCQSDDGIAWSFGTTDGEAWGGDDRLQQNSTSFLTRSDPKEVAEAIVRFMRFQAVVRVKWLNEFVNKCVGHIEETSATSPNAMYPVPDSARLSRGGVRPYEDAWKLVNQWRQR